MKIKAINLVDLYNYSMQTIAWEYEQFAINASSRSKLRCPNITPEMLRDDVNGHLNKLNRIGFNKNTVFLIVDPSNPIMHIAVDHHKYAVAQGLGWSLLIDPDAREYFCKSLDVGIPTSIKLSEELEYIKRNSYSYIKFITFAADFQNSILALRHASPIDIDVTDMLDEIRQPASNQSMIIDSYAFYNKIYGEPIEIEMDFRNKNILNTIADRAISTILN